MDLVAMVQSIRSKERTSLMSSIWQDIVGFFKDLKELGSFLIENTKGILTAIALMVVFFGTIIAIERYKEAKHNADQVWQAQNFAEHLKTVKHNGHLFLLYKEGDGNRGYGGMCHHPDCPCCKSN